MAEPPGRELPAPRQSPACASLPWLPAFPSRARPRSIPQRGGWGSALPGSWSLSPARGHGTQGRPVAGVGAPQEPAFSKLKAGRTLLGVSRAGCAPRLFGSQYFAGETACGWAAFEGKVRSGRVRA